MPTLTRKSLCFAAACVASPWLAFSAGTGAMEGGSAIAPADLQIYEQQAQSLVQQFAGRLKPKLQQGLASGGPVEAIAVCATEAPAIAAELSADSDWQVKRVSSRNRNPAASPDSWEAATIESFEQQLAAGAEPDSLQRGQMTPQGYRFARAQIAEPMCLMCHGQNIAEPVAEALARHYPQDQATGYRAGEIRGIFSLLKPEP